MTNHTHYIWTLCRQLSEQGLTPSVALIRARADRSLPIPAVIKALNSWKEDPAKVKQTLAQQEEGSSTEQDAPVADADLATTILHLKDQINAMANTIEILSARVDKLERAAK